MRRVAAADSAVAGPPGFKPTWWDFTPSLRQNLSRREHGRAMHICLDIDDTITYSPEFFRRMVASFEFARVTIVTFRDDRQSTEEYLGSLPIRFDQLIVSTETRHSGGHCSPHSDGT